MASGRFRSTDVAALLVASAALALLVAALLVGSTPDEEEFRFAVLSAWLRAGDLAGGAGGLWSPLLGLGMPQPFVPNFAFHPLAPLLRVMEPIPWIRLLLIAQTAVGALGTWQVGASLRLAPLVNAVCVATFLLAAPVQNYLLADFWPSHHIAWTLSPWLLVAAWRVLDPREKHVARWAAVLGLVAGMTAVSANPAYLAVYTVVAVAVVAGHAREALRKAGWLLAATAVAVAIGAPTLLQLVAERAHFAPDLRLSNVVDPLPMSAAWDAVARPFEPLASTRTIFFGAPFAALCLVGAWWYRRSHVELVLGLVLSAGVLFMALVPLPFVSQRYQFRDALTLCAIPLAGLAADRLLQSRRMRWPAAGLLAVQVGSLLSCAWPLLERAWGEEGRRATAFRGATASTPFVDRLVAQIRVPGRLLFSPRVDREVSDRVFLDDGLGVNALAYRGVAVVNGMFKGVSADPVWPNDRLFYGRIRTPGALVESSGSLDVLGIRYVLGHRDEAVAPGLRPLASLRSARGAELVLYANDDAWGGAFLVDAAFGDEDLPAFDGCGHDRLFCRDLAPVAAHARPAGLTLTRGVDEIRVSWPPAGEPRILVLSEMFRPDWAASAADGPLTTRAMYGALLGVPLPAGVSSVRLVYRPPLPRVAMGLWWAGLLVGAATLIATSRRSRRPSATSGTAKSP